MPQSRGVAWIRGRVVECERRDNAFHHTRRKRLTRRPLNHLVEQRKAVAIVAKRIAGNPLGRMRQEMADANDAGPRQGESIVANRIVKV